VNQVKVSVSNCQCQVRDFKDMHSELPTSTHQGQKEGGGVNIKKERRQ